tara:strand:- start:324 stop:647 length:324 start_codon:yes stop_codon:yes gene_type:complete
MTFTTWNSSVLSGQWPTGLFVIETPFIKGRDLMVSPQVLAMTVQALVILGHPTMIALALPHPKANIRVTIEAFLVGNATKTDMAAAAFILVVEVSMGARQWRRSKHR